MPRIVIFGNSGSGKSTLAQALASQMALTHLDLDTLAWDAQEPTKRRAIAESARDIERFLAANDRWVVEGCYSDLLEVAIARCDRVIFLNPGTEACLRNCRARPWEPHKYSSPAAQDRNLPMLLDWVRAYETREDDFSLKRHRELYERFGGDKTEQGERRA